MFLTFHICGGWDMGVRLLAVGLAAVIISDIVLFSPVIYAATTGAAAKLQAHDFASIYIAVLDTLLSGLGVAILISFIDPRQGLDDPCDVITLYVRGMSATAAAVIAMFMKLESLTPMETAICITNAAGRILTITAYLRDNCFFSNSTTNVHSVSQVYERTISIRPPN
ncbi:hypothetical protein Pisl_1031 [Pyrobaculum islandicum DSM 4184]|uniref:Uncharacterized protein n=1 Tax=Pyrobaculum islandicum (strain DSM 4184 / JCM 9189 / GEO3) TaxID=384616 RepID=A1RTC3_PYRIL|nr:hypothetical protein Pisl_1031 [Pyrobaculum islandicum DSM 4184]